ncbi:MAG: glycosyltransferase family 2 protein [Clostridia bacterium]|nr:glycosyltransferase family 2 protein [Clostridia bacterium]MDE7328460.1 glycosyltransferase family 2 protein [Clostridia bacterium]
MNTVAVLLSTYNGEKFLKEQLDSILNQSGVAVELFIRDDGSKDSTLEMLATYVEKFNNIHLLIEENVGVGNSFMKLLYSVGSGYDYYSFADQDDIWEENKLFEAVTMLAQSDKVLYASNQECVDKYGNSLGLRYGIDSAIHLDAIAILEKNTLAGCTMVFKGDFYDIITNINCRPSEELLRNRIHDVWLAMTASINGGIIYDERSFIKYRQHENNVVGAYEDGVFKKIKEKMKKVFKKKFRNGRSSLAKEILIKFPEQSKSFPLIKVCAEANTFGGKFKLIKNSKLLRSYTKESCFGFFFKVMLGYF